MVATTPEPDGTKSLENWIGEVDATQPRDHFTVPSERARDFLLMYGPCMQASRFASSYVLLSHAGYPNEATPLARAAFKHAITAHWAYFTKGGTDRFAVDMHRDFGKYVDALADFLDDEELRSVLDGRPVAEGKGMPTFADRMRELDHRTYFRDHLQNSLACPSSRPRRCARGISRARSP